MVSLKNSGLKSSLTSLDLEKSSWTGIFSLELIYFSFTHQTGAKICFHYLLQTTPKICGLNDSTCFANKCVMWVRLSRIISSSLHWAIVGMA